MKRSTDVALYPLLLEPIYKEKVWGGRALERLGRALPGDSDTLIGESWELADLGSMIPSEGGGGEARTRVSNGPLLKRSLHDILEDFGTMVTGRVRLTQDGRFPLLVKYLDACQDLSIQVHPSPGYAEDNPPARLKSEAWYIVDAEPGSVIYKGILEGTSREQFAVAIEEGTVSDLLIQVPARAGECHYMPSGTCHALGGGILVAEIQTPSDTTFRVYDWGRTDRELHIEQALQCIEYGPARSSESEPGTTTTEEGAVGRRLVLCEHFSVDEWILSPGSSRSYRSEGPVVLMSISGSGLLEWGEQERHQLCLGTGQTVLLPAALTTADFLADKEATLLEVGFPDSAHE